MTKADDFITTSAGITAPVFQCGIVVVGSGAAAFNAAHTAKISGVERTVLVTEGLKMGTSRNTGSDKQTYYKLSTAAMIADSAREMAEDLFRGGSMHGDIALTEAMGSLRGFYKLVSLGVPFPHDIYGEYTGYRTDHDAKRRATSCGPLTSKHMTEALECACVAAGVEIFDGFRAVELITVPGRCSSGRCPSDGCPSDGQTKKCVGIIALSEALACESNPAGACIFSAPSVIWATGGPSAVYCNSVYPESQTCGLGAPLRAGASAVNLTEWQYGLASLKFRWNVSGSYQQVIPRYISADSDGSHVREFLLDGIFSGEAEAMEAVFKKGYEWPFDPGKLNPPDSVSSRVDIAVYREIARGRRVYLDFRENPAPIRQGLTPERIGEEAYGYLKNCHTLDGTPVSRLRKMNEKAYQLYLNHGIDLETEPLEIGVCAQHMNGGLEGDIWYESPTIQAFFPVGEACGVFGVKRPGGSALNSTQVSAQRAAEKAAAVYHSAEKITPDMVEFIDTLSAKLNAHGSDELNRVEIVKKRQEFARKMDSCAAFIRKKEEIIPLAEEIRQELAAFDRHYSVRDTAALLELEILRDTLTAAYAILCSILAYMDDGGLSRGSYLIRTTADEKVSMDSAHYDKILRIQLNGTPACTWLDVRPIPTCERWFEDVYNHYGNLFDDRKD